MTLFSKTLFAALLTFNLLLFGCGDQNPPASPPANSSDASPHETHPKPELEEVEAVVEEDSAVLYEEIPDHSSDAELITIRAKFIEFELGDASHFIFEDSEGKVWDFGGCEDSDCDFAMEVPLEEADESNQGWGSNPEAQGKWYDLGYYETERELYIDGPVGTVYVIAAVLPVE